MHQTSPGMLRIHTLFLDVQEHHLCSQSYAQESSCALDNLKDRKKTVCVLLQNEVCKMCQDTGNSSLNANVNIKLVVHFFFWTLLQFPTFPILEPNTMLRSKLLTQPLNAYILLHAGPYTELLVARISTSILMHRVFILSTKRWFLLILTFILSHPPALSQMHVLQRQPPAPSNHPVTWALSWGSAARQTGATRRFSDSFLCSPGFFLGMATCKLLAREGNNSSFCRRRNIERNICHCSV